MSNKTNITPGVWKVGKYNSILDSKGFGIVSVDDSSAVLEGWEHTGAAHWSRRPGVTYRDVSEEEYEANIALIAEAGTVTNECGKPPRELLELVRALRGALITTLPYIPVDMRSAEQTDMRIHTNARIILENTKNL